MLLPIVANGGELARVSQAVDNFSRELLRIYAFCHIALHKTRKLVTLWLTFGRTGSFLCEK